ncbi:hypothetical protein [Sphaerisporangium krabiense]|uniref:Uncharacterized protein n=1 Tax=Sphaerisporangium krabiense TaxID=763782 RepID=A0A7W8Z7Q1_9ACTN|nr:hypothetical protein [Sphaerisporangium krabiense]MBB5628894.1 hypothetical protein [Sphaerisporangium krabiense]
MAVPDPRVERVKLARAGREWFADVMLTSLLLGHRPQRFNTPYRLCVQGRRLLHLLDLADGEDADPPALYWEFKLDAVTPGEENRWPDLAFRWPHRLLIVELKTEPGSVRERQVDQYLELGLHNHPGIQVDLLYLTRDRVPRAPVNLPERARYVTATWGVVARAIDESWGGVEGEDGRNAALFARWIRDELIPGEPWNRQVTAIPDTEIPQRRDALEMGSDADAIAEAMRIADLVQADRRQRAIPYRFSSKAEAEDFRSALRENLLNRAESGDLTVSHVRPWVWTTTSTGTALTEQGRVSGIEVRLSYYKKAII